MSTSLFLLKKFLVKDWIIKILSTFPWFYTYIIETTFSASTTISQLIIISYYWLPTSAFKGYLHYKTIISQNMSSEPQGKNFFILLKSYIPFSRYSSFCIFNHLMIYQICDVMMNISIWKRICFSISLLHPDFLSHQTWPIDTYKQGQ